MSVLAIDGGQSGIRARWSGSDAIAEVDGVSRLEGDVVAAISHATSTAWRDLGAPAVDRVVMGLTTSPSAAAESDRLAGAVAAATGADEVWVCDDTVTAHAGALWGGWGVSLRVGTGVACLAVPEDGGTPTVVDGLGYLLGDDGGAFWIGREGLRFVLRLPPGARSQTMLGAAAEARFGHIDDLHVRLHEHPRAVNEIAQFARDVVAHAAAKVPEAVDIIDRAAIALADTVRLAVAEVDTGRTRVPVAVGGRLLEESALLNERLTAAITNVVPQCDVTSAAADPLSGALALGTDTVPNRYAALMHQWRRKTDHA